MNKNNACPECGSESVEQIQGFCPVCLLKTGLEMPANIESEESSTIAPTRTMGQKSATLNPTTMTGREFESSATIVHCIDDYELINEIARGGMGVVFKARQISLNRIVALKMILGGQIANADDVSRFRAEAESAAQLDHPGIVQIFEVGEHNGTPFFSMAYVDGSNLADTMKNGPLEKKIAAQYVSRIANSISYAHKKKVIHRDLKPSNILLDKNGELKITDFGLAKRLEDRDGLTNTGQILGTPSYMSPEQAAGQSTEVNESTDVYSMGAILYALLTGRPPFQSDNPVNTVMEVLESEPVPPARLNPSIDRDLETITLKCIQKQCQDRYPSADELAAELERYLRGEQINARRVSKPILVYRWVKRNPVVSSLAIALTVCFLFLGIAGPLVAIQQSVLAGLATNRQMQAERNAYSANCQLMASVLERQEFGRLYELLWQTIPRSSEFDLRGWEWCYFYDQYRRQISDLPTGDQELILAEWDRSGTHLGVLTGTGALEIWQDQKRKQVIQGVQSRDFAWSPDGKQIALQHNSTNIELRNLLDGKVVRSIEYEFDIENIDWSEDGDWIAVSHADRISTISTKTGERNVDNMQIRGSTIRHLKWHPTTLQLAVASRDGCVRNYDGATGILIFSTRVCDINCYHVEWSPDGNLLAAAASWPNYSVFIIDKSGKELRRLSGHTDSVKSASWSPDGSRIVSAGADQLAIIWDSTDGKRIETVMPHAAEIYSVDWHPTKDRFCSVDSDGKVKLWSLINDADPGILSIPGESVRGLDWSPCGSKLASVSYSGLRASDRTVRIWDVDRREVDWSFPGARVVSWHPDGTKLATFFSRKRNNIWEVRIWNTQKRELERSLPLDSFGIGFFSLEWTSDGRYLAAGTNEQPKNRQHVHVWDTTNWSLKKLDQGRYRAAIAWNPKGDLLAVGSFGDGKIKVWDVRSCRSIYAGKATSGILKIAWDPTSSRFAVATKGGVANIWNAETGLHSMQLDGHAAGLEAIDWSQDGERIVTGSLDQSVRIWDPRTGNELLRLSGHDEPILSTAWGPNSERLASGDKSGVIRLWGKKGIRQYLRQPSHEIARPTPQSLVKLHKKSTTGH